MTWISSCLQFLGVVAVTAIIVTVTEAHQPPKQSITTRLQAPWAPTSLLHEASEYLGELNPNLFWSFLETTLQKLEHLPTPATGIQHALW